MVNAKYYQREYKFNTKTTLGTKMGLSDNLGIDVIEELDLRRFSKKRKEKIAKKMEENLSSRLVDAFSSRLNTIQKAELRKIIQNDDDARSFLQRNVSNPQKIIDKKVNELRNEARDIEEETKSNSKKKKNKEEKYKQKILNKMNEMDENRLDRMTERSSKLRQKKIRRVIFMVCLAIIVFLIYFFA